jgi:uncharacterized membrane protein
MVLELLHAIVYLAIGLSYKKEEEKERDISTFSTFGVRTVTGHTHGSRRTVRERRENETLDGERLTSR